MRLRAYLSKRMSYVDDALSSIDPSIAKYLKIGVTEGVTYDILRIKGCRVAEICITKHIVSFSGSLAPNGNDAKNTSPIMEEYTLQKT